MADPAIVDSIANNIASLESGGHDNPYSVEGPKTASGDRAYGRYQIMGNNIPAWSEEAGYGRLSPRQFMADPFVQDHVAKTQIGKLHDKYGTAKDVASVWHSGVPFDRAAREGRQDRLGTHTVDYATHVAKGIDPDTGESTASGDSSGGSNAALPPDMPNLGEEQEAPPTASMVNPQTVLKDEKFWALSDADRVGVMAKVDPKFAKLAPSDQTSVLAKLNPQKTSTSPPATDTAAVKPVADVLSPDDTTLSTSVNKAMGVADDHPLGKYASDVLKPLTAASIDFVKGASNITHPSGFKDALNSFLQIVHHLGAPAEIAGNLVFRAATDSGASPATAASLATAANMGVGMLTPIPGGKAASETPLMGSDAARSTAKEAAAAAERASTWAEHTKTSGVESTAAANADVAATTAAGKSATDEAAKIANTANVGAEKAAERVAPSTDVTARAKAALTPADVTPEQGGQVIKEGLKGELAQSKSAVGGIYDTYAAEHGSDPVMNPTSQRELSQMIQSAKDELGATFSGATEKILTDLQGRMDDALKGQQPLNISDFNEVKTQLDGLLRGGAKTQKNTLLNQINMKIRDVIRSGASGEDAEWLAAADHLWKTDIAGREMTGSSLGKMVNLIKKSDPDVVVDKLFGNGNSAAQVSMAKAVMKRLDSEGSGAGEAIRQANFARLFKTDADGALDPAELLKRYDDWHPDFRGAMNTPGAETFFKVERQMQADAVTASAGAKTAAKGVKEAEKGAAEATTAAEKRVGDIAKGAAKDTATTAKVAEQATTDAATAAEAAKAPNQLAKMTARGLKLTGAGLTEALGQHLGIPGIAGAAGLAEMLIPTDHLARLLANSKTANILARALKTPVNSAVVPALLQELRSSKLGKELLSSPAGQQKQQEATDTMMATETP